MFVYFDVKVIRFLCLKLFSFKPIRSTIAYTCKQLIYLLVITWPLLLSGSESTAEGFNWVSGLHLQEKRRRHPILLCSIRSRVLSNDCLQEPQMRMSGATENVLSSATDDGVPPDKFITPTSFDAAAAVAKSVKMKALYEYVYNFPRNTKAELGRPLYQDRKRYSDLCIVHVFCFPIFWPWCIYASCNTRTGRPWK